MKLSACYCTFQRVDDGVWENGIAVTTEHGLSSTECIVDESGNLVAEYWNYRLDWTASMYPRVLL